MKYIPAIFLFVTVFSFFAAAAQAAENSQLRFIDEDGKPTVNAPGIATEIDIDIHGTLGHARVIQYFANNTDEWQEGKYTYPLPEDATIDRQVMVIGDRRIIGFVAERQKAKQIYEQAKREGKATSLIEQHRENIFQTSVANIPPGSLIAIEIGYQFEVAVDGFDFSMRVPMAITPRYDNFSPEEFITLASNEESRAARELVERLVLFNFDDGNNPYALHVSLDAGFELGSIKSTSHNIKTDEEDSVTEITTEDEILKGEQDFVLEWQPENKTKPLTFLHSEKVGQDVFSHLVIMPPPDTAKFADGKLPPRQVTMIIDVSGSMAGPSIKQAKAALIEALEDLSPQDYFNLISFESKTQWLFDDTVPASADNIKKAIKWVAGLEADGGTVMQPAIERALSETHQDGTLRQVVFITDGAIGYEGQLAAFIKNNVGDARFYAVGIGAAPNSHLMRLIAMAGRGTFTSIGSVRETEDKMAGLFKKMKAPVLYDLTLHLPDNISAETIPAKLPDLMAGEPISIAVKSDKPLRDLTVTAQKSGRLWTHEVKADREQKAEGVGRVFARRKIQEIKYGDPNIQSAQTEPLITAIALEHQIMSDYTSFVAVDEKTIRPAQQRLAFRRYNPNLPKGWSLSDMSPREASEAYQEHLERLKNDAESQNDLKHDIDLPQTASNWIVQLILALLLLVAAPLFWRRNETYTA